jgi:hypothetical protein
MFIRLYLVPFQGKQQIIDIPATALVLSQGQFVPVQVAPSITLIGATISETYTPFDAAQIQQILTSQQTQELRICWREPVESQQYSDNGVIEANDPSGGQCICGVTCSGTEIAYVQVKNVEV